MRETKLVIRSNRGIETIEIVENAFLHGIDIQPLFYEYFEKYQNTRVDKFCDFVMKRYNRVKDLVVISKKAYDLIKNVSMAANGSFN